MLCERAKAFAVLRFSSHCNRCKLDVTASCHLKLDRNISCKTIAKDEFLKQWKIPLVKFRRTDKKAKRGSWLRNHTEGSDITRSVGKDKMKRAYVSGHVTHDDVVDLTTGVQNTEQILVQETRQQQRVQGISPNVQSEGQHGPKRNKGPSARPRCRPPSLSPPRRRTGTRRCPPPEAPHLTGCRSLDGAIIWLRRKLG